MRLLISAGTEDLIAALNCRDYNEAGKSTDLKLRVATRSAEAEKARTSGSPGSRDVADYFGAFEKGWTQPGNEMSGCRLRWRPRRTVYGRYCRTRRKSDRDRYGPGNPRAGARRCSSREPSQHRVP